MTSTDQFSQTGIVNEFIILHLRAKIKTLENNFEKPVEANTAPKLFISHTNWSGGLTPFISYANSDPNSNLTYQWSNTTSYYLRQLK
jgi:hypothetical protein